MRQKKFPPGWDEERVRKVIAHYEQQNEEEAVAEDEAAFQKPAQTIVEVPRELLPAIRELIASTRNPGKPRRIESDRPPARPLTLIIRRVSPKREDLCFKAQKRTKR